MNQEKPSDPAYERIGHPDPHGTGNRVLPGYDVTAVEKWLSENVSLIKPPCTWTKLEGGHSNLTYLIEDAEGSKAVIRRPPTGELLPKAHDMGREWALISALGPTKVPVPAALGFCEDPNIIGAHFYVMGLINGHPLYTVADTERYVPPDKRTVMAHSFIDVLAQLHAVEPDAVGLGTLGKKENYIGRQLNTWYKSWNASIAGSQFDDTRAHQLHDFFRDNMPEQGPARVVHGDYGMHNCLVGPDGRIAAVVDWEISTLGDPLADLAYALNHWAEPNDAIGPRGQGPTAVPGFPSRAELATRYAVKTGRNLAQLDYYIGFNRWKSAAIVQGVYARYLEGKKSAAGIDLNALRESINLSLLASAEAVGRL
ncbi:MAG: phosphotransferase family protein [Burkholderiaceae bacterium]